MARTNLSLLPDVTGHLRDTLNQMFNNSNQNNVKDDHPTVMIPEDNDIIIDVVNHDDDNNNNDRMSIEDLQSSLNKRKFTNTSVPNKEEQNQAESPKRLCTTTSHQ